MFYVCLYCVAIVADGPMGYHKRSLTPISVLKAGHVEHLPQCIYFYNLWISISLSLSLSLFLDSFFIVLYS